MALETIHVLILFSLFSIWLGRYLEDFPITALAGIMTFIIGIYITIYGIAEITLDVVRYGIGLSLFAIGAYVSIRAGLEKANII